MTRLDVLTTEHSAEWMDVVAQSFQHDFYHLLAYHALAEERGEGRAHLFVYRDKDYLVAAPLLLRPIWTVPCHARIGEGWWDATSVYGYAGPIASHSDVPASVVQNFQAALRETMLERRVVSVFSRLHPLIPQRGLLAGLDKCIPMGQTVSIDLALPVDVQRARYRKELKHSINKLRRLGVTCLEDQNRTYLNELVNIYYETMRRVNASDAYFFEHTYFERLVSTLGSHIRLFVCLLENEAICAGLFTLCDGIVQFHLSGTRNKFLKLAPTKLLLDTVRLWANEREASVFHLGGGVGSQEDSLFDFKSGFSDGRHEFAIWRWVPFPEVYDQLCEEKMRWNKRRGLKPVSSQYFPAYRCPDCCQMEAGGQCAIS